MRRFKLSRNSLTIEVNLYDGIDFVCPFYNATDTVSNSSSDLEYYVIYLVRSYMTCITLNHIYLFLSRVSTLTRDIDIAILSDCPSVHPSICLSVCP